MTPTEMATSPISILNTHIASHWKWGYTMPEAMKWGTLMSGDVFFDKPLKDHFLNSLASS